MAHPVADVGNVAEKEGWPLDIRVGECLPPGWVGRRLGQQLCPELWTLIFTVLPKAGPFCSRHEYSFILPLLDTERNIFIVMY